MVSNDQQAGVKGVEETNQQKSKTTPEPSPMRMFGTGPESVRIISDDLEKALDRLYNLELARRSVQNEVLHLLHWLGHPGHIPENIRERAYLLLHL